MKTIRVRNENVGNIKIIDRGDFIALHQKHQSNNPNIDKGDWGDCILIPRPKLKELIKIIKGME